LWCVLSLVALAAAWVGSRMATGRPPELADTADAVVAVTTQDFDDERRVRLSITTTAVEPLSSHVSGTVTASTCLEGTVLRSGDSLGSVDGRPLRILATSVPLWRDLNLGDRGSDVDAVQTELKRLGLLATVSGRVDAATRTAVRRWLGTSESTGPVLPLGSVVWLPAREITVATCALRLGAKVSDGGSLLVPMPTLSRVSATAGVRTTPGQERTLTVGSVTVPLAPDESVTDVTDLAALAGSAPVMAWLRLPSDQAADRLVEGTTRLREPIQAASVPPAAVIGAGTEQPCLIESDGTATAVRVLSSQLGRSVVTAAAAEVPLPALVKVDYTGRLRCPSS
jgi:hypothetical protein